MLLRSFRNGVKQLWGYTRKSFPQGPRLTARLFPVEFLLHQAGLTQGCSLCGQAGSQPHVWDFRAVYRCHLSFNELEKRHLKWNQWTFDSIYVALHFGGLLSKYKCWEGLVFSPVSLALNTMPSTFSMLRKTKTKLKTKQLTKCVSVTRHASSLHCYRYVHIILWDCLTVKRTSFLDTVLHTAISCLFVI